MAEPGRRPLVGAARWLHRATLVRRGPRLRRRLRPAHSRTRILRGGIPESRCAWKRERAEDVIYASGRACPGES